MRLFFFYLRYKSSCPLFCIKVRITANRRYGFSEGVVFEKAKILAMQDYVRKQYATILKGFAFT